MHGLLSVNRRTREGQLSKGNSLRETKKMSDRPEEIVHLRLGEPIGPDNFSRYRIEFILILAWPALHLLDCSNVEWNFYFPCRGICYTRLRKVFEPCLVCSQFTSFRDFYLRINFVLL